MRLRSFLMLLPLYILVFWGANIAAELIFADGTEWGKLVTSVLFVVLVLSVQFVSQKKRLKRLKKSELIDDDYFPFQSEMIQTEFSLNEIVSKLSSYGPTQKWTLYVEGNAIVVHTPKFNSGGNHWVGNRYFVKIEKKLDVLLLLSRPTRFLLFDDGSCFYNIMKMKRAILGEEISVIE